jgi:hypothetical protein
MPSTTRHTASAAPAIAASGEGLAPGPAGPDSSTTAGLVTTAVLATTAVLVTRGAGGTTCGAGGCMAAAGRTSTWVSRSSSPGGATGPSADGSGGGTDRGGPTCRASALRVAVTLRPERLRTTAQATLRRPGPAGGRTGCAAGWPAAGAAA